MSCRAFDLTQVRYISAVAGLVELDWNSYAKFVGCLTYVTATSPNGKKLVNEFWS